MNTSVTIASSLALRLRCLAGSLHGLGPRATYEYLCEIVGGSSDPLGRLEAYAAINPEILDRFNGRDLPPAIRVIK